MARFLFATQPAAGYVAPALPIVSQLVAGGHEVVWYTGQHFQLEDRGASGRAMRHFRRRSTTPRVDMDEALPERSKLKGLALLRYDLIQSFMGQIGPMHRDMQAILRSFPADVVVGDPTVLAVPTLTEAGGPPCATLSVTCLGMASRDVAPFGFGLQPSATPLGGCAIARSWPCCAMCSSGRSPKSWSGNATASGCARTVSRCLPPRPT